MERLQAEQRTLEKLHDLVSEIDRDIDRRLTLLQALATSPAVAAEDWASRRSSSYSSLRRVSSPIWPWLRRFRIVARCRERTLRESSKYRS